MAHTSKDKGKLLARIRRIGGQVDALEKAVTEEQECSSVLQQIAACRGAISGLMSEVIEGHIRHHVIDPDHSHKKQAVAAEELIAVLKTYLR